MSATPKDAGGKRGEDSSELTRLKRSVWHSLSDSAREYWRERMESGVPTQMQVRGEMFKKLKVNLQWDRQLTNFRAWLAEQDVRDQEAETSAEDSRELEAQGLKGEALRAVLLDRMKTRSLLMGDFKLGLAALKVDLKAEEILLDRDKFEMEACELILTKAVREAAERIAGSSMSQADKIAAMRKVAFADVEQLLQSGKLKIPKA